MRTYTLHPGTHPEYLKVYESMGAKAQKEILGHMVGYYSTDIGPLNQIVHMWAYKSLNDRSERRTRLAKDPRWKKMLPELRKFIKSQESKILIPANFSPINKID